MKNNPITYLLIVVAAFGLLHPIDAQAEPANAAKTRAALYHSETRAVLESRRWMISLDQQGKIVANHLLGTDMAGQIQIGKPGLNMNGLKPGDPIGYARLTITFQPDSATHTKASPNIVAYLHGPRYGGGSPKDPLPFNQPINTKEILSILAEADKQLSAKHPEFSAR